MTTAAIIGASGYSGAELLKLLQRHSSIDVTHLFAHSSAGKRVDELYPSFRSNRYGAMVFEEYSIDKVKNTDLIFIALPSGEAMNIVPDLFDAGKRVIDLGGDFRLHDGALYTEYYNRPHSAAHLLSRSVYGLPEWNRKQITNAQLIANPGCYVTSALLPLLPLLNEGLIASTKIVINSLSGISGAGRSSSVDLSFTEANETVKAYKSGTHQHTPEIETILEDFAKQKATVTFVPHLLPITRGIYSTIYAERTSSSSDEKIAAAYHTYYEKAPFVRILGDRIPEIKHVQHTNFCDIGWKLYERNNHIIIHSVLDNLIKGAAGQAVQNMNIMFGFNETDGLV